MVRLYGQVRILTTKYLLDEEELERLCSAIMGKYDYTPEVHDQILAAIIVRLPNLKCPLGSHYKFTLSEGFVSVPLYSNFWINQTAGSLVFVAYSCDTCGNTLFLSMSELGLGHLVAPSKEELRKWWGGS
jgi:hypothetical protein